MGDAAADWRAALPPGEDHCQECGGLLGFLEGPSCDGCITQPLPPWQDKYEGYRDENARLARQAAEKGGPPSTGRDRVAVNLRTGEVLRFGRR